LRCQTTSCVSATPATSIATEVADPQTAMLE
jgi:hypothetical protein